MCEDFGRGNKAMVVTVAYFINNASKGAFELVKLREDSRPGSSLAGPIWDRLPITKQAKQDIELKPGRGIRSFGGWMHLEGCDEFGNVTCGVMVATKCLVICDFVNNVKVSVISMYAQRNRAIVDEFITLGSIMLPYLLETSMDKISFNNVFNDV